MQPIAAVERFLERLLERPAARLFHSPLQPIQIQRRIERAIENERRTVAGRTRVPDWYRVHLAPSDSAALGERVEGLARDLADEALAFARAHGYSLERPPTVELISDRSIRAGEVRVSVERPGQLGPSSQPGQSSRPGPAEQPAQLDRADQPGEPGSPGQPPTDRLDRTRVFEVPLAPAPSAS
ncbi:MAG: DUF3662 domain-containing protein, partial [Candidatus Limnocylindrales bacterium]